MSEEIKQLSLVERWKLDIESYKRAEMKVKTASPQCKSCLYFVIGDAFHCQKYKEEKKPEEVIWAKKECSFYTNKNPIKMEISNGRENKFYGALFGFCVGDMIGVPVEFSSRREREKDMVQELRAYGTYHQPFGTWSDDTSLTLCLIDAINKGFSLEKVSDNFISYYEKADFTPHGEVFDIGNATRDAIEKMIRGVAPDKCGGDQETDNGNGSLMRVLPLAFYGENLNSKDLIKLTEDVSALTHAHKRSKLACIFYVVYAMLLIQGYGKAEAYDKAVICVHKNCKKPYKDELKNFENILSKKCITFSKEQIKSTGYVIDTLEAVLWCFYHADSYKETILNAVNLGGDTDTIAAIAGGIAGIYYGYVQIPDQWIQNISRKEEMQQMFSDFYKILNNAE